ncbi:MAG TPA: TolC family protein [Terriglobia bacterium]|jgi:cobalt-zinc-cadmium efflux system outer membrane protein
MTKRFLLHWTAALLIVCGLAECALAQQAKTWTWQELKDKLEAANPTLLAGQLNIDESRADEVTAYLRPNPDFSLLGDQVTLFSGGPFTPFANLLSAFSASYLHERRNKRELRLDSARRGTEVAQSQQADLERNLLFNLRNAFVQTLQAKAVYQLVTDNLSYYDNVLNVSRERFRAGDIAQIDLDRLELQRSQFESDVQNAIVALRNAKIQLLMLLDDRTPVEQFDIAGVFDFQDQLMPLGQFRMTALNTRPDLKAAVQAVEKAKVDHDLAVANGSTDPTFGVDGGRNPPLDYIGFSVSIPLRIFDRNQGEKQRTQLDITRNQRLQAAALAQVYSDVDSAYSTLGGNLTLLRTYKNNYLERAVRVRDTISFAYQRGGASLLDFLQAQQDYRTVQLGYLNLVGSYMTAASQMNLAVGTEVLQ